MKSLSLRLRLALAGFVALILALVIAGVALTFLFERHVYRTVSDELDGYIGQIIGGLSFEPSGDIVVRREPNDPGFETPASGLYWEVTFGDRIRRSKSLAGATLVLPDDELSEGQTHYHQVIGPDQKLLLVAERRIDVPRATGLQYARVILASDLTRMRQARDSFARELAPSLAILGLFLTLATWAQLTIGLRPLSQLRRELAGITGGQARRMNEAAPLEVRGLVTELNQLLAAQEAEITRARGRAADLAHGLKTPLAALAGDARIVRDVGRADVADSMDRIGETMRRHVERELMRARVRASALQSGAGAPVRDVVDALARTLARTDRGAEIAYDNKVPSGVVAPFDRADLLELLGNLLDNATRHAGSRVRISTEQKRSQLTIRVDDDGPGIDPALDEFIRQRGKRLDNGGSAGLGLSIVQDIIDAYGWRMDFGRSMLGGLEVTLSRDLEADVNGRAGVRARSDLA